MGKVIGIVILLLGLGLCAWVFIEMNRDQGEQIRIAFGNEKPADNTIEMHIFITTVTVMRDGPRGTPDGEPDWAGWADAHFKITDQAGNRVSTRRNIRSDVVSDAEARVPPDHYQIAVLTRATEYTLEWTPETLEPRTLVYQFTSPVEARKLKGVQMAVR